MEEQDKVNGQTTIQPAIYEQAKSNGHNPARFGPKEAMEWFPYGEGTAPVKLNVLPYAVETHMFQLVEITAEQSEAERTAIREQITALIARRGKLQAALTDDELDDKPIEPEKNKNAKKLNLVNARIDGLQEKLEKTPTTWFVRARDLICQIIADDQFELDGEKISVTPEAISQIKNLHLISLYGRLSEYFFGGERLSGKWTR